jgi:hypothetical protein
VSVVDTAKIVPEKLFAFQDSTSNFNKLLMSLAMVDSLVIVFYIVDVSWVYIYMCPPVWFRVAFPYFLNPAKYIVRTASIFMVVAISAERSDSTHNCKNIVGGLLW